MTPRGDAVKLGAVGLGCYQASRSHALKPSLSLHNMIRAMETRPPGSVGRFLPRAYMSCNCSPKSPRSPTMFDRLNRRRFMTSVAATWASLGVADRASAEAELQPTPACEDGDATLAETEGPFFKPRSPERSDLREPGVKGTPVELTGLVLTSRCRPVERALVDLWHADDDGNYDNAGFRLR